MTRIRSIVAILSFALLLTMGSSTAQIQVFDPSNYAQNLQTAANTLKQINNQLTALVAAQGRAAALELARKAAAEDQAREQTSRFLNNGQTYQPQTAQMFH